MVSERGVVGEVPTDSSMVMCYVFPSEHSCLQEKTYGQRNHFHNRNATCPTCMLCNECMLHSLRSIYESHDNYSFTCFLLVE